jgi:hypothetical protein
MAESRPPATEARSLPVYLFFMPWDLRELGGVNQVVSNLALQMKASGDVEPVAFVADWNAVDPSWDSAGELVLHRFTWRAAARAYVSLLANAEDARAASPRRLTSS